MNFNLSTFCPKDNEFVIWKFDTNIFDLDTAAWTHDRLQEFFPNNQVISIPSSCSLETMSKEELEKIINSAGQN